MNIKKIKKDIKLTRGSIKKWESVKDGTIMELGGNNCPLCREYIYRLQIGCKECPIYLRTGKVNCFGTPYEDWGVCDNGCDEYPYCDECNDVIGKELKFLHELLNELLAKEKILASSSIG